MAEKNTVPTTSSPLRMVLGLLGAGAGYALIRYAGLHMLIPLVAMIVLGVNFALLAPARTRPMAAASAVLAGHAVWMMFGYLVSWWAGVAIPRADLILLCVNIALLPLGALMLLCWSSLAPVTLVTLFESAMLVVNGYVLVAVIREQQRLLSLGAQLPEGVELQKALSVHVVFRVMAIVLMVVGYVRIKQRAKRAKQQEEAWIEQQNRAILWRQQGII